MFWRQIQLAFILAVGGGYFAFSSGASLPTAIGFAGIIYLFLRVIIATVFRTSYWIARGTRGAYSQQCPECGQNIYRKEGDWILRCYRCGWTAGLPVIRWLTQSVPARQLGRSISGMRVFVLLLAVAVLAAGSFGVIPELSEIQSDIRVGDSGPNPINESLSDSEIRSTSTVIATKSQFTDSGGGWNTTRIERSILRQVNQIRSREGMTRLAHNERAAKAAQTHARDMAVNGYFSHTSLSGETQRERYSFCQGGENAAQTWVNRRVKKPEGGTAIYTTERELANAIIDQWMNSKPHRERGIFGEWWRSAGVGVAISDNGKVYAVMGFCSQ